MSLLVKENLISPKSVATKLNNEEIAALSEQLPGWRIISINDIARLEKSFSFNNFAAALTFTNKVGALADTVDHHPAILTEWGKCTITWWTHSHRGLLRNDFIMAAKTDQLYTKN
jgi:4a-hydroxytetrahydrobiopterin dehydratase